MEGFIFILNFLGTLAFAASGAMIGLKKNMDIFGVCILGLTTATGGPFYKGADESLCLRYAVWAIHCPAPLYLSRRGTCGGIIYDPLPFIFPFRRSFRLGGGNIQLLAGLLRLNQKVNGLFGGAR